MGKPLGPPGKNADLHECFNTIRIYLSYAAVRIHGDESLCNRKNGLIYVEELFFVRNMLFVLPMKRGILY